MFDVANYTGQRGEVITLMDYSGNHEGMTNAIFQHANRGVMNSVNLHVTIRRNDSTDIIE